jgi:hypothetical protein
MFGIRSFHSGENVDCGLLGCSSETLVTPTRLHGITTQKACSTTCFSTWYLSIIKQIFVNNSEKTVDYDSRHFYDKIHEVKII